MLQYTLVTKSQTLFPSIPLNLNESTNTICLAPALMFDFNIENPYFADIYTISLILSNLLNNGENQ